VRGGSDRVYTMCCTTLLHEEACQEAVHESCSLSVLEAGPAGRWGVSTCEM
jgi:hypothetical protein